MNQFYDKYINGSNVILNIKTEKKVLVPIIIPKMSVYCNSLQKTSVFKVGVLSIKAKLYSPQYDEFVKQKVIYGIFLSNFFTNNHFLL